MIKFKPFAVNFHDVDEVAAYDPAYYHRERQTWIATAGRHDGSGFSPEDFAGHIGEEYSTYSWILEEILRRADFQILEAEYLTPTRASYTCRKLKEDIPTGSGKT